MQVCSYYLLHIPVQHNGMSIVLTDVLLLQTSEHCMSTIKHCVERDCVKLLIAPHGGGAGDHSEKPSDTDITSVGSKTILSY